MDLVFQQGVQFQVRLDFLSVQLAEGGLNV